MVGLMECFGQRLIIKYKGVRGRERDKKKDTEIIIDLTTYRKKKGDTQLLTCFSHLVVCDIK